MTWRYIFVVVFVEHIKSGFKEKDFCMWRIQKKVGELDKHAEAYSAQM